MNQQTTVKKIIEEIKDSNPAIPRNYFDMELYFGMAYAVGFNEGRASATKRKPILQLDKYGNVIREFDSTQQASRITKICHSEIAKVCNGKRKTAGGYKWRRK